MMTEEQREMEERLMHQPEGTMLLFEAGAVYRKVEAGMWVVNMPGYDGMLYGPEYLCIAMVREDRPWSLA